MSAYEIIDKLIEREGGYVNDIDDPGKETKYGISRRVYPDEDILNLTKDRAKHIYFYDYYVKFNVAKLPIHLREMFFDMTVHMGYRRTVKILQKAINGKAGWSKISVDGVLGNETLRESVNLEKDRLSAYRVLYYSKLITRRPVLIKYWFGWFNRAVEV